MITPVQGLSLHQVMEQAATRPSDLQGMSDRFNRLMSERPPQPDVHMVLSRKIAARNQYPAIDVLGSLSRVMAQVVAPEHQQAAGDLRRLMAKYDELETLLQMGEYKPGNDGVADEAVAKVDLIREFLNQSTADSWPFAQTLQQLQGIVHA